MLNHPAGLGYSSDCPSTLDLLDGAGCQLPSHLDMLGSVDSVPAALHLADLVDAVFAGSRPFESVSRTTVVEWLRAATSGERLEQAFFAADSPEERALSAAHELWTVCAAGSKALWFRCFHRGSHGRERGYSRRRVMVIVWPPVHLAHLR